MSNNPAVLSSPLSFVDPQTGQQFQVPAPLVSFSPTTGLWTANLNSASAAAAFNNSSAATPPGSIVPDMLGTLAREGLLTPGVVPPVQALTMQAVDGGSLGNLITVTFARPVAGPGGASDPTGVVDVAVSTVQVFQNIALSAITSSATFGLVNGSSSVTGTPQLGAVAAKTAGNVVSWPVSQVPAAGTPAFTLLPNRPESSTAALADVQLISVVLQQGSNSTTASPTLTITVKWAKAVRAVQLGSLVPLSSDPSPSPYPPNPLSYLVNFLPIGSSPGTRMLPDAGTYTLSIASGATNATAVAVSG